jgi:uncharacterized protein YkwD
MPTLALRRVVSAAIVAGCLLAGASAPASGAPTPTEKRLIQRINETRADHGLRKVVLGPRLQRGAHAWARQLLRTDAFRHARLAGGTSEILAWGAPCSWMTPLRAVRLWLKSPGHRAALLARGVRYVGAGWAAGAWRSYRCTEIAAARFR